MLCAGNFLGQLAKDEQAQKKIERLANLMVFVSWIFTYIVIYIDRREEYLGDMARLNKSKDTTLMQHAFLKSTLCRLKDDTVNSH